MLGTNSRLPCSRRGRASAPCARPWTDCAARGPRGTARQRRMSEGRRPCAPDRSAPPRPCRAPWTSSSGDQVVEGDAVEARRVAGAARRVAEHDRRRRVAGHRGGAREGEDRSLVVASTAAFGSSSSSSHPRPAAGSRGARSSGAAPRARRRCAPVSGSVRSSPITTAPKSIVAFGIAILHFLVLALSGTVIGPVDVEGHLRFDVLVHLGSEDAS